MTQFPWMSGTLGLGDIIDRAFRLYRTHFGRLIRMLAVVLVPWAALYVAVTYATAATGSTGLGLLLYLISLADSLVTGLAGLAVYFLIDAILANGQMTAGEAWRRALGRFWSWLGMTILMGLAMIGAAIPGIIIFSVSVGIASISGSSVGPALAILIGFIVMLIPMMLLMARWLVAEPALVAEGLGATASLGRSWRLTKGRFWRCVGFAVLLSLLNLLISGWVLLPTYASLFGILVPPWLTGAVTPLLSKLLTILWLPLQAAAYMFFYYDLRVRAEGYDLAQRVEQLAQAAGLTEAEQADAAFGADEEPAA